MSKPALLVTAADLAPQALELLQDFDVVYAGKTPQVADLVALARRHDPVAIIVRYGQVPAEVMDAAPALKVISKHGSGTDTIDKAAAAARGIEVTAAAGANAAAVAEQAMALLLACAKSVVKLNDRMHHGYWDKATHKSVELAGRTVGVIGYDPFAQEVPEFVERVELPALFAQADALSLHCPLTEDNRNLLDAKTLALCKRGVIVVNTGRGGLIDETALLEALASGQVAMAGLDAFAQEPTPQAHPFFGHPQLVLSPHIGGVTSDAYVNMGVAAARNVLAVLGKVAA